MKKNNTNLKHITKLLDQPADQRWTSLVGYLQHPEPWCRRRATKLFQYSGGLISLEEVLQRLESFPEDVLEEALEWLRHWQWPGVVAPSGLSLSLLYKYTNNSDIRIARVGGELLASLDKHKWPEPLRECNNFYAADHPDSTYLPPLIIYLTKEEVRLGESPIELTRAPKRILFRLAEADGLYVDSDILYGAVQGEDYGVQLPGDVKSNIRLLRKHLGDNGTSQWYIQSQRSLGYRLNKKHVQIH